MWILTEVDHSATIILFEMNIDEGQIGHGELLCAESL